MLELTVTGAVVLTARLVTHGRTAEETAAKLNRPNFLHRAYCVGAALAAASSYQEAAEALVEGGWFTELGAAGLAAAMEAEADDLMTLATGLGLPIGGMIGIKAEAGSDPQADQEAHAQIDGDDIPI